MNCLYLYCSVTVTAQNMMDSNGGMMDSNGGGLTGPAATDTARTLSLGGFAWVTTAMGTSLT